MSIRQRWDRTEYQRIAYGEHRDGQLIVRFEDDSCASVAVDRVLPARTRGADWDRAAVGRYEIVVPTAEGPIEVPWSTIRVLTDREYSAHLAAIAEQEARHIGLRIRELREGRGLTGRELAERAGITPQSLSRIEHGRHDVVLTTLQRILAAMGCSLGDLAEAPRPSVSV